MFFVNADLIAQAEFPLEPEKASYEAAKIAEKRRYELISQGLSFCFETVFSHVSKIDFIADCKAQGYEVNFVYIHLDNNTLNQARVFQRVSQGGHNVPANKIISRIPRTIENVIKTLPLVDDAMIFNNSSAEKHFELVARIKGQRLTHTLPSLPDWAVHIVGAYLPTQTRLKVIK